MWANLKGFFASIIDFFKGKDKEPTPVIEKPVEPTPEPSKPIETRPIELPSTQEPTSGPTPELEKSEDDKLIQLIIEKITGDFEGEKVWDDITGNFDGMGLSVGALQWCYGQGSLQSKILQPYIKKHGSIDALNIFPKECSIDKSATMSDGDAIKFANKYMAIGDDIKKVYKEAWSKFLLKPEVIQIQTEACYSVLRTAKELAGKWGMSSTVAYIWFFDVITQNGSLKGIQKPAYDLSEAERIMSLVDTKCRAVWKTVDLKTLPKDQVVLFIASHRRATKSISKYFNDVFARKGTIALGKGFVHGSKFDFTQYYK